MIDEKTKVIPMPARDETESEPAEKSEESEDGQNGLALSRAYGITAKRIPAFLEALSKTGAVGASCRAAGIPRSTAFDLRSRDRAFATAWDAAMDEYIEGLEREVDRRAFEGNEKGYKNKHGEWISSREYSDALAMFRLRALAPHKYKERQEIEMSTPQDDGSELLAKIQKLAKVPIGRS